ncbi:class I SAM-dependent methyltransferase [Methylobacterium sp. WL103]|uniref:class I SAM-dependent methyltransferase n=1 Tax=Methylobacterium sp. WL103 TaxID=2603891 RepID=UPI001FEF5233|nr:class I SAM-dependent methyltransferase [Methylobacterium sp. WL103]
MTGAVKRRLLRNRWQGYPDPATGDDEAATMDPTFKDHFSSQAAAYAAHRPTYPAALAAFLAEAAPGRGLAFDAACGTGQLSTQLAAHFGDVVATDASAAQIANATPYPRVTYRTAPAERSGLTASSADLITVAQAAHWLDLDAFYDEVRRIARPGAVLALVSYGILHVEGEPDGAVRHFYDDVVGPYWPPERRHVEDGYRSLPFSFAEIAAPDLAITVAWSLADLIGYVETWSALRGLEKAIGRGPVDAFHEALAASWGPGEQLRTVRWPLSLRLARV